MVCLQSNSSQVASADVLGPEILSIRRESDKRFELCSNGDRRWLKKRNATPSTNEKYNLLEARIKALRELVWFC
jgi:hypothetical protein